MELDFTKTKHLLSTPTNAKPLLAAIRQLDAGAEHDLIDNDERVAA